MVVNFANPIMGYCKLSTEHASSSHGIPVLVDEHGKAYGPADRLFPDDWLGWMNPDVKTAADLIRKYALADYDSLEPRDIYDARIAAAKLFLGHF